MFLRNVRVHGLALFALAAIGVTSGAAQSMGTVRGTVTRSGDNAVLAGVQVTVRGVGVATVTNANGKYVLQRVPAGPQTVVFRWLGYTPIEKSITVNGESTVDAVLDPKPVSLADLTVSAVSREPERSVEAPAASTSIEPRVLQNVGATGQAPLALAQAPGVDLAQSGVNDFNINARGFNSSLNRRVLTLLDGRDLAIAFLGSQEWSSIPTSTEDLRGMELVRGPGSALYGANAFAGVINMTTLSPREVEGAKISVSGGELNSFKVDGRAAKTFSEGRWGVRIGGGYGTSDTWSRSRTQVDSVGPTGAAFTFSMRNEYQDAVKAADNFVVKAAGVEALPLAGQTLGVGNRAPIGDRDPLKTAYGSARLDRHFTSGAVVTVEGGASQSENETLVTGIGRVQVLKGFKPYARVAYNSEHLNIFGYMNRRETKEPQKSLASGADLLETSTILHAEAQANRAFLENGKAIIGASFRQYNVNTDETLMRAEDDDRHDKVYSAYTQLEYKFSPQFRLVGAARYDKGDLFEGQFSPKAALVFSPTQNHSFRATFNKAFQTPNYSEFFLRAAAAPPVDLRGLETFLRDPARFGPALTNVPVGQLFTASATVPVFARGNANLGVEKTNGYELGYKGSLSSRLYVTVDAYQNNIKNFVTDLLPGVNPTAFPYWTAPTAVPEATRAALAGAVRSALLASPTTALAGAGLSRTENGNTAIVLSYTNAGKVDQKGIDVGIGFQFNDEFRVDGSYSWFDFTVKSQQAGDQLLPNTPGKKGTATLSYEGTHNGFDASISGRFVASYDWAAGVLAGRVPSSETFSANAGWQMTQRYRIFVVGTNIFDQQRYQLYGGAVIGRRVLAGLTAAF